MMFVSAAVTLLVTGAQLASAHFSIEYPTWRADSLENQNYSQWTYPCAGVKYAQGNRTDWPLQGGALELKLHHPWTYLYVNLALDGDSDNYNYTLVPGLLNVTGRGTFCLPALDIPVNVTDGTQASIQVVTNGASGSALYNCADITFRSGAKVPDGMCKNDTSVQAVLVGQSSEPSNSSNTTPLSPPISTSSQPSSAPVMTIDAVAFTVAVAMACAFAAGMGM
ncbi:hypothetical protein GGR54DRAFT_642683 [Hypoxylon sp. NC1633]|nr:hypothetical protein GGR54DRAFT_642683 [Hypoxylon sp. NC1633]